MDGEKSTSQGDPMVEMALARGQIEVTDESLVLAARNGDLEAFSRLIDKHREVAYAYAASVLQNREDAEDVVQEAFVRAFTSLDRFRTGANWAAWQMRIVQNLCRDALRRRKVRRPVELNADPRDTAPGPEALVIEVEGRRILEEQVRLLPDKHRIPLMMRYGFQRSYKEIALALGLPESTVVGRLAGALRTLRRRLNGISL